MIDDRLCPKCLAGRMRVRTSNTMASGTWTKQWLVCKACGHRTSRVVPRATIFNRVGKKPNSSVTSNTKGVR